MSDQLPRRELRLPAHAEPSAVCAGASGAPAISATAAAAAVFSDGARISANEENGEENANDVVIGAAVDTTQSRALASAAVAATVFAAAAARASADVTCRLDLTFKVRSHPQSPILSRYHGTGTVCGCAGVWVVVFVTCTPHARGSALDQSASVCVTSPSKDVHSCMFPRSCIDKDEIRQ